MGFFDKVKASVGIGGAKIELRAPHVVFAHGAVPVDLTIKGGNLDQILKGIDLGLYVEKQVDEPSPQGGSSTRRTVTTELAKHRIAMPQSEHSISRGTITTFTGTLTVPEFHQCYEGQPHQMQFSSLVDLEDDPFAMGRDLDRPLPTLDDLDMRRFEVSASADIPGAVDPSARQQVFVLPEPAGTARPIGKLATHDLWETLRGGGARRAFPVFAGDRWFLWLGSESGQVAALADLQAIVSVRPEGVVRSYTNPSIPLPSVLGKLPSETDDRIPGGMVEARAWAERLARDADVVGVLARPIGNAYFAVNNVRTFG
jgi:hypothetical protein